MTMGCWASPIIVSNLCVLVLLTAFSRGDLNGILRSYDTLHSRDLVTHHVAKRDAGLENLFNTERLVSFSSFGRSFRIRLYQQEHLFSDNLFAAEVGENQTTEIFIEGNEFYAGFLDGEPRFQKAFAYWEDDNIVATIRTRNDTYFIEPSWRHLPESDNYTMIVYRLSDVKETLSQMTEDRVAFCGAPDVNDNFTISFDANSTSSTLQYANLSTGRHERTKRSSENARTMCSVMLVADYRFYDGIGQSSVTNTAKYMIGVMSRVNSIYMSTDFGQNFGELGFQIEGILVHSDSTADINHYNRKTDTWDTSELLNAFSSVPDWQKYCLVHLFTFTAFESGVLGLAWVASDKRGSLGGICSQCSGVKCYNTGWSTSLNKFKRKLSTLEADLVTAHELGHGWGAQHDPDRTECSPSSAENGKYIMYPFSVSGRDPNNNHFSPCSRTSISSVLQAKKETCFKVPSSSFCGNNKVEEGEDCDAGTAGRAGIDRCCDSQCHFVNGAVCSDINSNCCQNCTYAPATKLCWASNVDNYLTSSCRANSSCTGHSTTCPETKLPDATPCSNSGHCRNGSCLNVCEYSDQTSCVCDDVEKSCVWCCKDSLNGSCQPTYVNGTLVKVADGFPCQKGYCDSGKCQISIQTTNRAWDFIQHLNVDQIRLFMRNNIVLATVILSLIPYLIFCIVICCIDQKKRQKAKQRQEWLHKENDRLTLDENSSKITKVEGIVNRRSGGHY